MSTWNTVNGSTFQPMRGSISLPEILGEGNTMNDQESSAEYRQVDNASAATGDANTQNEVEQTNKNATTPKLIIPAYTVDMARELTKDLPDSDQRLINSVPFDDVTFYDCTLYVDTDKGPFKAILSKKDGMFLMLKIGKVFVDDHKRRVFAFLVDKHHGGHLPTTQYVVEYTYGFFKEISGDYFAENVGKIRPEFMSTQGNQLSALIKFYFFKEGITVPYEITLVRNQFQQDLLKAVKKGVENTESNDDQAQRFPAPSHSRAPLATASSSHQQISHSTNKSAWDAAKRWGLIQQERKNTRIKRDTIRKSQEKERKELEQARKDKEKASKEMETAQKTIDSRSSMIETLRTEEVALIEKDTKDGEKQQSLLASLSEDERNNFRFIVESVRDSIEQQDDEPLSKRRRT
ncbi:hypothetical protein DM02DRAFT_698953 [Periconia macrospinosa]|uniref:Uncharacterized protein n=1 Tax=Periconia macrospinosa TaxID=97972 RepID=A0A2V1DY81_9PLEO|nr:hypothetical protein DM02DRAFT_698953 [Periconia macrospinosa]